PGLRRDHIDVRIPWPTIEHLDQPPLLALLTRACRSNDGEESDRILAPPDVEPENGATLGTHFDAPRSRVDVETKEQALDVARQDLARRVVPNRGHGALR